MDSRATLKGAPDGFRFYWNRDDRRPGSQPVEFVLVGWRSSTPRFYCPQDEQYYWSARLEDVAVEAWQAAQIVCDEEVPNGAP